MFDVFDDLNRGRIVVPSEPEIAIRVGRSLGRQLDANPGRLSETLAVCPALTLKVLRAAKSVAREGSALRSTRAAVERLGPEKTFALAVNCILRESLRSDSPVVRGRMRAWWERTVRVAAISAYLARTSERFDPEKARLVGLLHSIGEPVMLGYAERHPDLADDDALDNVIYGNRGELGRILLTMWDLPRDIIHAATLCNHWQYEHPGEADYTDLLLVAQWHAMIGDARSRRSPSNEEIPAFARLGLGEPEPEVSIRIVDAGAKALELVDSLLLA